MCHTYPFHDSPILLLISCDVSAGCSDRGGCCAIGVDDVDGDCSSFIIDFIPLSATFKIVSNSFADFSALLTFFWWWWWWWYSRASNGSFSPFNLCALGYDWKNDP